MRRDCVGWVSYWWKMKWRDQIQHESSLTWKLGTKNNSQLRTRLVKSISCFLLSADWTQPTPRTHQVPGATSEILFTVGRNWDVRMQSSNQHLPSLICQHCNKWPQHCKLYHFLLPMKVQLSVTSTSTKSVSKTEEMTSKWSSSLLRQDSKKTIIASGAQFEERCFVCCLNKTNYHRVWTNFEDNNSNFHWELVQC